MNQDRLLADAEVMQGGTLFRRARRVLDRATLLSYHYSPPSSLDVLRPASLLYQLGTQAAEIASAYLMGAREPQELVQDVAHAIRAADWNGEGEAGQPRSGEAIVLWHAVQLDVLSLPRHSEHLYDLPTSSGLKRDAFLATYRHELVLPALQLRPRLWIAGAVELYDEMWPGLEGLFDHLAEGRLDRLDANLQSLLEVLKPIQRRLLPREWRRLVEVPVIRHEAEGLLKRLNDAEFDPASAKSTLPRPGIPYEVFRNELRHTITESSNRILELAHRRILASQLVAIEKYFSGDTLHKPLREDSLFRGAREAGHRLGLGASTAEDISRLLLAKAREVQEHTLNQIAARLAEKHGTVLDAEHPEHRLAEADLEIPSFVARLGDQPLARENQLIKELRLTSMNEEHPRDRAAALSEIDDPHPYLAKGLVTGSRDLLGFFQALSSGDRCKVIASFSPASRAHLGHGAIVNLLTYFQRRGADIVLVFRDLDVVQEEISIALAQNPEPRQLALGRLNEVLAKARTRAEEATEQFLAGLKRLGLRTELAEVYTHLRRPEVFAFAMELGTRVRLGELNSAFGLHMANSATTTILPLLHVADLLHQQTDEFGGPCRTLVVSGIERDGYIRVARGIATELGFIKPSALYVRMVRSLVRYEAPDTGVVVSTMTGRIPRGAIFYSDDAAEVRKKIRVAVTGGRATRAEQEREGGNPDPRICSVSSLWAFHGAPEADEYEAIKRRCTAGELLCGECKSLAAEAIVGYLDQVR